MQASAARLLAMQEKAEEVRCSHAFSCQGMQDNARLACSGCCAVVYMKL